MLKKNRNIHLKTVESFDDEWSKNDQENISNKELKSFFLKYFSIFPWSVINTKSIGFDLGCGTGRWAKFVSLKVKHLHCIDPSSKALNVAKKKLKKNKNVIFHNISVDEIVKKLKKNSQDFGYSLGVLHHIPNTELALKSCYDVLKPGSPFLVYLYYSLDNKGFIFRSIWLISNILRIIISSFPNFLKNFLTDFIAYFVYYPIAKLVLFFEKIGFNTNKMVLNYYKNASLATMRTDSRDRFGTPLEKRFSKIEIYSMMKQIGFVNIKFRNKAPYWCAIGYKKIK